jgi:tetratricopeptide (TPR) repeat protein
LFEGLGDENKINPQNNYSEALKNYTQNLSFYEKIKDRGAITTSYNLVGNIHFKLGNFQIAKTYLEKALRIGKEIGSKGDLQEIYRNLSKLDSSQKNYQQALEHYKMHILYRDSISNEETKKQLVRASMQYEFDKKEAVAKAEQDKKDAEAKRVKNLQYFAIGGLGVIVLAVLLIASVQWRHNKQKQKANTLLTQQKEK